MQNADYNIKKSQKTSQNFNLTIMKKYFLIYSNIFLQSQFVCQLNNLDVKVN